MKTIIAFFCVTLFTTTLFAQEPNQICRGLNENEDNVETHLYIIKKVDKEISQARLHILWNDSVIVQTGTITNEADLMGTRMFKNKEDSLRFLTSGFLYDIDNTEFRAPKMRCTKFKNIKSRLW